MQASTARTAYFGGIVGPFDDRAPVLFGEETTSGENERRSAEMRPFLPIAAIQGTRGAGRSEGAAARHGTRLARLSYR